MTEKQKESIKYTLATCAAESLIPSKEALKLCQKIASGKLSGEKAVNEIKKQYGIKGNE